MKVKNGTATKTVGKTTEYYKWNSKKKEYILVPEMTVTMDK